MTKSKTTTKLSIIPTDCLGRMLFPPDQRERLLDAFEQSGMSAAAFARLHGIKYPTLASWRQKRNRERMQKIKGKEVPFFEEGDVSDTSVDVGLRIELPGGAQVNVDRAEQFPLAAALLRYLEQT